VSADFVPIAEDTGLIIDIGRWVLAEGCRQLVAWRAEYPELVLNVNVSGRQLVDPDFTRDVAAVLDSMGVPARNVTLELTESVLMSDPHTALPALDSLKALGVNLAVDDFGTGYSSLAYLCRLPVDELKIDRTFVTRAHLSADDAAIVRTVLELGRTLRLTTVAEGIENEEQLQMCKDLGCDIGQGYYLRRPGLAAEITGYLDACRAATVPA
jgi:EAL domain-containing protein (putative c-di-GMP-specific phosphodiesterase class I)